MKILSVSTHSGDDAYSWRVNNIQSQLVAHGNQVRPLVNRSLSERNLNLMSKVARVADAVVRTSRDLNATSYDLIYGNASATFYCLTGRLRHIPLVFDMHGMTAEEYLLRNEGSGNFARANPAYLGNLMMDQSSLRFSDTVVCVSKCQMEHLNKSRNVPAEKLVYAPNGVDLSYFKPQSGIEVNTLRRSLGLEGRMVFGYIGGTDRWQGVEQFIAAANAIRDSEVAFLVVGGKETYIKGNFVEVRRQPRDRLLEYYAVCDVLVLPRPKQIATEVASPTKFAEYAAMGKPILSTAVGDPRDMIRRNECGIVIADNKPDSLADGVMRFKGMSAARLSQMGSRSRILAEQNFDWNRIGANLVNALLKYER